jgi:hypothetical protein
MRAWIRNLVVMAGLLGPNVASASDSPVADGLVVGGLTLGGELVGGTAGGLLGFGGVVVACVGTCLDEALVVGLGGVAVGGVGGGSLAAAFGAQAVHVRSGRTAAWTAAVGGVGVGMFAVGLAIDDFRMWNYGPYVAGLGMPIAAGIAAATDRGEPVPSTTTVSVTPVMRRDFQGVRLSGRF